jgi:hypothetical protein
MVGDEGQVGRAFYLALGPYRVNPKREFFSIEPEQAIALLQVMALEDVTPSLQQEAARVDAGAKSSAEKLKRSLRPPLNYLNLGIPAGSTLVYVDGETTFTVLDGRHVSFCGESALLSAVTAELRVVPVMPIHGTR